MSGKPKPVISLYAALIIAAAEKAAKEAKGA